MRHAVLLALLLAAAPAAAQRLQLAGELRVSATGTAATAGQLGTDLDSPSRCGQQPLTDLGGGVTGALVGVFKTERYRYQLGLGAGYYQYYCTPSLSRPVGGLDYRGEHHFGPRTLLTTDARGAVDAFDRSLDIRTGTLQPGTQGGRPPDSQLAAGKPFFLGMAGLDVERQLTGRYGLRSGLSVQTMQLFSGLDQLDPDSTLGPMEVLELHADPFRDTVRERIELLAHYQLSHFFAATQNAVPLQRFHVPAAQDAGLSAAWERRFSELFSLHIEGGLAAAYQPNLCQPSAAACAPNLRGTSGGAPPLEVGLGRQATGTFVGQLGLSYKFRRNYVELALQRLYEPSFYASSLVLTNRLSGNVLWHFTPDVVLTGTLFLSQLGFTSPVPLPQNRTLLAAVATVAMDFVVVGPLALFTQLDGQVYAIRGERVTGPDGSELVPAFPPAGQGQYQTTARLSLTAGLRLFFRPSAREADLLTTAHALP